MQNEEQRPQNEEGEMFQLEFTEEHKRRLLDIVGDYLELSADIQNHILHTNDPENPRIQQYAVSVGVAIMTVPWHMSLDMLPTIFDGKQASGLAASAWELGELLTRDVQDSLFPQADDDEEFSEDDE